MNFGVYAVEQQVSFAEVPLNVHAMEKACKKRTLLQAGAGYTHNENSYRDLQIGELLSHSVCSPNQKM
jgi:hypothetical protein